MKYQVNWGLNNEPNMWDDKPTFVCPKCGDVLKFNTGLRIIVTTDDVIDEDVYKSYGTPNPSRYAISDGVQLYHQPCDELIVQVDEPIAELVQSLIRKGYVTDYSCGGHSPEEYWYNGEKGAAARKKSLMNIGCEIWTEQIYVTFSIPVDMQKKHHQEIVNAFEKIEQINNGVRFDIYGIKDGIPVYAEENMVTLDVFKNHPECNYNVNIEVNVKALTEHVDVKHFIDAQLDTARKRLQEAADLFPMLN